MFLRLKPQLQGFFAFSSLPASSAEESRFFFFSSPKQAASSLFSW